MGGEAVSRYVGRPRPKDQEPSGVWRAPPEPRSLRNSVRVSAGERPKAVSPPATRASMSAGAGRARPCAADLRTRPSVTWARKGRVSLGNPWSTQATSTAAASDFKRGRIDPHPEGPRTRKRREPADPPDIEDERRMARCHGGQGASHRLDAVRTHPTEEFEGNVEILGLGPGDPGCIGLETLEKRLDAGPPVTRERDRHEASDITHRTPRDQPGPTLSCGGFAGGAPWRPISRRGRPRT